MSRGIDGHVQVGMGHRTIHWLQKANATARVDGVSVGAVRLSDTSIPYHRATVQAFKPGSDEQTAPTANSGNVYICGNADPAAGDTGDMTGAPPIVPGDSCELPEDCDLMEMCLAVDVADDGVLIQYED